MLFNLNGSATIDFSTLYKNVADTTNNNNGSDGSVCSLAYGNDIGSGGPTSASLTINHSIITFTTYSFGFCCVLDDVVSAAVNGSASNTANLTYLGVNVVGLSSGGFSGNPPLTAGPNLGALANNGGPTQTMLPAAGSPVIDAAVSCALAAGGSLGFDQRGATRPRGTSCDLGAVEVAASALVVQVTDPTHGSNTVTAAATPTLLSGGIASCTDSGGAACAAAYSPNASVTLNLNPAVGWKVDAVNTISNCGAGSGLAGNTYTAVPGASCTVSVVFVVDPCGTANGVPVLTAPAANLCNSGFTAGPVSGSGPWTWTCNGSSAPTTTCSAPRTVTSITGMTAGGPATATMSGGGNTCTFDSSSQFASASSVPTLPVPGTVFPQDLFKFKATSCTPGVTLNIAITYAQPLPGGGTLWKYGRTSARPTAHWYPYPAVINGNVVSYQVTDGGSGDDDLTTNGTLIDPAGVAPPQAGVITVTDNLSYANMGGTTCTLSQAIATANLANGVTPDSVGSGTTDVGFNYSGPLSPGANKLGNCTGATSGANSIVFAPALAGATLTYTTLDFQTTPWNSDSGTFNGFVMGHAYEPYNLADNVWYGLNALPPITSAISIDGGSAGITLKITLDTSPSSHPRLRFFYVSGGLTGELPAGSLSLHNMTLTGGVALGGTGASGGAGMGGAIFNQGTLNLTAVTLTSNSAIGGRSVSTQGHGGMGDWSVGPAGAGMGGGLPAGFTVGPFLLGGAYGGRGGGGGSGGSGGGGGFITGSDGGDATSGAPDMGGGLGGLGGCSPGTAGCYGDGGGGAAGRRAAVELLAAASAMAHCIPVLPIAAAESAAVAVAVAAGASAAAVVATVASAAAAVAPAALVGAAASVLPPGAASTGGRARAWAARSSIIVAA